MCKERCPIHNAECESRHQAGGWIPQNEHYHVMSRPEEAGGPFMCAWVPDEEAPGPEDLDLRMWFPLRPFDSIPDGANPPKRPLEP